LRFAVESPEAFAFLEFQQHESYLDAASAAVSEQVETAAVELVRRGQRSGEIRAGDPEGLMALADGALVGLAKAARRGLTLEERRRLAAEHAAWSLLSAAG